MWAVKYIYLGYSNQYSGSTGAYQTANRWMDGYTLTSTQMCYCVLCMRINIQVCMHILCLMEQAQKWA